VYLPISANGAASVLYDVLSIIHALITGHRRLLILGTSGALIIPWMVRLCPSANVVVNIDGIEWRRQKWRGLARRFLRLSEAVAVKHASTVVADNRAIADYVKSSYGRDCRTIAYGGDHAVVPPTEDAVNTVRGIGGRYAFGLCRIEPENNVHMILEAFSRADMALVFVGNWQSSEYGRDLLARFGKIYNLSLLDPIYELETLSAYRSQCEVYVHGHSAGGTNPSLVEMMHFAKPIAAFDCIYNRATMTNEGSYFTSAIDLQRIIHEQSWGSCGETLAQIAQSRYTWSSVRTAYTALFYPADQQLQGGS
jgi:glycosyltransferase involved in cell wall biosynthesis